ncbi:MAG: TIGR03960 family B12-binding radical SAM protein [Myxococcota bacterium]|nr:TIGR03960 family B12-binding radical SAM protein [Myxococcota bacterium]
MNLADILDSEILPLVEKPSRYLGRELNAVMKNDPKVRLALAFPDLYDVGLGNLGLHILYAILNQIDGVWAERVYAPAVDMEGELRSRGLKMFALESKDTIDSFDGIGFTLQSELTYTNILNLMDLAGLPVRAADRGEGMPLMFAGGPSVFNPEPLVAFMDFFVVGDGEDAMVEIAQVFLDHTDRESRLLALSKLEGIYVPSLYPTEVMADGRIFPSATAPKIRKRIARDLNAATFPVDYIVPFTQQVHDRISLEVLRGCTQGCRFCQAGMTTRPVRERSIDNIETLLERTLESTGYEEVSLVSLSTCDYSQVRTMVEKVVERAAPDRIGVSLPSLRLDSFSVELADMVADIRRTGLTFAPEAASPRLRALINKWIPDEELLTMATEAYSRGWDHVKLYFMIGLPTERDDDIEAIADLTLRTLAVGRELNRKARVHTGVSTFVPKPFTPLQWARQISIEETKQKQEILWQRFGRNPGVKFGRHPAEETYMEGLVSRGDRSVGDLIERAWQLGCKFDAWDEHRRFDLWMQAVEDVGFDPEYAMRRRKLNERLPWDHIDIFIPRRWFAEDWARALVLQHAEDCRHSKCHRCGVIDEERALCSHMLRNAIDGKKSDKDFVRKPQPHFAEAPKPGHPPKRQPEPPAVQRLVFRVGIRGSARFLGHLETMNAWLRALRRARTPVSYSEGFHPHPKVAFESARPLGEESMATYMDITLKERTDPRTLMARLEAVLPDDFRVLNVTEVPLKSPSLMSQVAGADYVFFIPAEPETIEAAIAGLVVSERIEVQRKAKKKKRRGRSMPQAMRTIDVKPNIDRIALNAELSQEGLAAVDVSLVTVESRGLRPSELLALLGADFRKCRVLRTRTRFMQVENKPVTGLENEVALSV